MLEALGSTHVNALYLYLDLDPLFSTTLPSLQFWLGLHGGILELPKLTQLSNLCAAALPYLPCLLPQWLRPRSGRDTMWTSMCNFARKCMYENIIITPQIRTKTFREMKIGHNPSREA